MGFLKKLRGLRHNFSFKVLSSLLVAMLFLGIAFNLVFVRYEQEKLQKQAIQSGLRLTRMLAQTVRVWVFAEDRQRIRSVIEAAFAMEGIVEVCVLNAELEMLNRQVGAAREWVTSPCRHDLGDTAFLHRVVDHGLTIYQGNDDKIEFWAPVHGAPQYSEEDLFFDIGPNLNLAVEGRPVIGLVGVSLDRRPIQQGVEEIVKKSSLVLFAFLVIAGLITSLIVREVTKPLNALVKKVSVRGLEEFPADQLGVLTGTYEVMIKQLGDAFGTISDLSDGLEKKVEELEREVVMRRQAEAARQVSEETARTLLNAPVYMAALIDLNGRILDINETMAQDMQSSVEQLIGRDLWTLLPDKEVGERRRLSASEVARTGRPLRFVDHLANNRWYDALFSPVLSAANEVDRIAVLVRDITEQKEAEKKRKEMEIKAMTQSRLASLGQVASGVAHEINQPLSFIKVVYEVGLRDIEKNQLDEQELIADFQEALRQVARITELTSHLRTFGRAEKLNFEVVSLPVVLENALVLMNESMQSRNIHLVKENNDHLPLILGNGNRLEQVFINLFQNAIDALSEEQRPEIRVSMAQEGEVLKIRFADNGPGIEPDLLDKIFEPFFSTKPVDQGTGLGLSIVYGIIKEHHGTIVCEAGNDHGVQFVMALPVAAELNQ